MAEKMMKPDAKLTYFLGFKEKEDDYEITDDKTGKVNKGHYHNFIFSLCDMYDPNEKARIGFVGGECNIFKVKAENVPYIFGERPDTFNPSDYTDWFLQPVEVLFDKRGNLKSLRRIPNNQTVTKIES